MNKQAFYKGLLSELEKIAQSPFNQHEPKKQPFYKSPGFLGAAGLTGLGLGVGAYGMLRGKPMSIPKIPSSTPNSTPLAATGSGQPSNLPGQISGMANLGQLGLTAATPLGSIKSLSHIPYFNKIPFNKFSRGANVLGSTGMIADSLDRNNTDPLITKMTEGGAGAIDGVGTALTSQALNPIAQKVAPTFTNWASKAMGAGARFGAMPLTSAYMAGKMGQGVMSAGGIAADANSEAQGNVSNFLSKNLKGMEDRTSTNYPASMQNLFDLYNDPEAKDYINGVTHPNVLARLGYGQYYHMPKTLGGVGYENGPDRSAVNNILDQSKSKVNDELSSTGMGPELAKNELESALSRHLSSTTNDSYANSVPSMNMPIPLDPKQLQR